MSKFTGKGPNGQKWAKFFNSCLTGSLVHHVTPGRGIKIGSTTSRGLTISTSAADIILFKLTEPRPVLASSPANGLVCGPTGFTVGATSTDIFFSYTPHFYGDDQVVVCQNVMGRWEVISPGTEVARGSVATDIEITGNGTVNLNPAIAGTTSVTATSEMFTVAAGSTVYLRYIAGNWYLDAKACGDEPEGDSEDGGSPGDDGDAEDGGSAETGSGDLDGGTP